MALLASYYMDTFLQNNLFKKISESDTTIV